MAAVYEYLHANEQGGFSSEQSLLLSKRRRSWHDAAVMRRNNERTRVKKRVDWEHKDICNVSDCREQVNKELIIPSCGVNDRCCRAAWVGFVGKKQNSLKAAIHCTRRTHNNPKVISKRGKRISNWWMFQYFWLWDAAFKFCLCAINLLGFTGGTRPSFTVHCYGQTGQDGLKEKKKKK